MAEDGTRRPHVCSLTWVDVGDARIHYERAGAGPPCLMLHGGFGSHLLWDDLAIALRGRHDVTAIDSRGHGRSTVGRGPITFGRMAVDAVRVLDALGVDRAHVIGHSDGGCTTLHLLVDHPDRVASATLMGTPLALGDLRRGAFAEIEAFLGRLQSGGNGMGIAAHHRALSSDPDGWKVLVERLAPTWRTQPTFTDEVLRLVEVPVLVIGVDRDAFYDRRVFERTAQVFPRGEVEWIENATHDLPMTHPERVAEVIGCFIGRLTSDPAP